MKLGTGHPWIDFNVLLFSGYALFGVCSFFKPTLLGNIWFILLHFVTLTIYLAIAYGLATKRFRINYVVVAVSSLMAVHLFIFLFAPLGMGLAYIGPSRAFYALFLAFFSFIGWEGFSSLALTLFNAVMFLVHLINICYFTRRKVAALFL